MSRLRDLIARHCPKGVSFKPLGEIGTFTRGRRFTKEDVVEQGLPSIHYGEIYTHYGTWALSALSHVRSDLREQLRFARPGDVVFAGVGETVEEVAKAVAWLGSEDVAFHDDCFAFRHEQDPKYIAYAMQASDFHAQKNKYVARAKVKRLSGESLAKIRIPVPPIEVQQEIVRVLDLFAELEAGLEAELEAELEARRRQYAYYRASLLAFKGRAGIRWIPMGELGTWTGGITPSKAVPRYWEAGTIPWIASMDISASNGAEIRGRVTQAALDETPLRLVPAPSIAVVMRSNILRRVLPVGFIDVDTTVNQDLRLLRPREGIDARFVYQALLAASEDIRKKCVRTDGSMAAVDSKALFDWLVPVPSPDEQHRIVVILDKFDTLVNDLSAGLPAEIRARRQQYEYHRDKLFTFEEAA